MLAADGAEDDGFGASVAVWGRTAVVAAPNHGDLSGSAYVFVSAPSSDGDD